MVCQLHDMLQPEQEGQYTLSILAQGCSLNRTYLKQLISQCHLLLWEPSNRAAGCDPVLGSVAYWVGSLGFMTMG
eukprot:scaffold87788_cov18-Tisochrysis_lutea.AAC.1